ncbi:hypothetical protein KGF56_004816 [Candida oxycetoniae]|uniref:C2H2-type domain-containing protein n=1 Tax=Candida oxycetoniae TaxID=497107 RepID=A0AAI9WVI9_9ASCO|nr:uncharacterized protein KGF56_004816 [Candida oxycetoniae]KAI3402408.2 hypothetical protein KGF56_004816 [Candida oxycetoniae]
MLAMNQPPSLHQPEMDIDIDIDSLSRHVGSPIQQSSNYNNVNLGSSQFQNVDTPTTVTSVTNTGESNSNSNLNNSFATVMNSPSPHKPTESVTSVASSRNNAADAVLPSISPTSNKNSNNNNNNNNNTSTSNQLSSKVLDKSSHGSNNPRQESQEIKAQEFFTLDQNVSNETTTEDARSPPIAQTHDSVTGVDDDDDDSKPDSENPDSTTPEFDTENLLLEHQIDVLTHAQPLDIEEYITHLNKLGTIIYENKFDPKHAISLFSKLNELMDSLEQYVDSTNPLTSQLYLLIEQNFDLFIKLATNYKVIEISTACIRFLTTVVMNLNYWEIYNLLNWKPVLYHFLTLINFDLNDCYRKFINDYQTFSYDKVKRPIAAPRTRGRVKSRRSRQLMNDEDMTAEERERTERFFSLNPDTADHDKYVADILSGVNKQKRKFRPDVKLEHHKIIKKPQPPTDRQSTKSSNYDPDVVHECQLPSAEVPHKLCLRRFSRKYELIRHQETVHSKKKKLFKCYVCVKQNPGVGPRIFTRHDTLAKHIRVNHEIFGKEAKAEVAYSKKHAEVVEEGDITVHVGRRKTKVDFELRAHMDKRTLDDGMAYLETSDLESGDEEVVFNNR